MTKHSAWTKKKHRSHVNGARYTRNKKLQERLDAQVKRLQQELCSSPTTARPK